MAREGPGKLDALLEMAEIGARHGIAFAEKAEIDPSVLAMIYERATRQRIQGDDASALDALRNYWRCALLGNVCWQLAHTPKAQPVDLSSAQPGKDGDKTTAAKADDTAKKDDASKAAPAPTSSTNTVVVVNPPGTQTATNEIVTPVAPPATTNTVVPVNPSAPPVATNEEVAPVAPPAVTNTEVVVNPPVAPIATNEEIAPVAPPAVTNAGVVVNPPVAGASTTNSTPSPTTPAPSPAATATNDANIPVAPIAKVEDYSGGNAPPATTNAVPVIGPIPPSNKPDNADGHAGSFP
jgi:hypothetical protein